MKVLVCVLDGKYVDKVLQQVNESIPEYTNLIILNIASYDMYYLNKTEEDDSLEYLYEKALECGAMVKVIRSNDMYRSLIDFIENEKIDEVFIEDRREFRLLRQLNKYLDDKSDGKVSCVFLEV